MNLLPVKDGMQASQALWAKLGYHKLRLVIDYVRKTHGLPADATIQLRTWPNKFPDPGLMVLCDGSPRFTPLEDVEALLDQHHPHWCWYDRPGQPRFT